MNNKKNTHAIRGKKQSGQAIVLAMALFLVLSVTLFLVFNSGRTVNEKINLVNAADAAAYSGAQIAARQLNFMAYTNRAMIANEVAIGHMLSFQMEVDIVTQSLAGITDALSSLLAWFPWLQNMVSAFFTEVFEGFSTFSRVVTGLYSIALDMNNATYSSLQYEAFKDFAYPDEGASLVESAMRSVLSDYEVRPTAPINLNDPTVLDYFALNGEGAVQEAATQAGDMQSELCRMMLFVKPGADSAGGVGEGNAMNSFCENLGAGETSVAGSPDSPVSDDGAMLAMLQATQANFGNAHWIRERDANYRFLGFRIQRRGSTTVQYDESADQLNWVAQRDTLRVGDPIFNIALQTFNASGDAAGASEEAAETANESLNALDELIAAGICGAENEDGEYLDCEALLNGRYGSIRRYAHLNPQTTNPVVTAFLSQSNCSDEIGITPDGERVEGWHDNLTSFDEGERKFCAKTVYAVSRAQVYFRRPPCSGSDCQFGFAAHAGGAEESANLFNPFWQVRLLPGDGGG